MALDLAGPHNPVPRRSLVELVQQRSAALAAMLATGPGRPVRSFVRYGLALVSVALATSATFLVGNLAEKPWAFPFYAAIVASAWFGTGPGCVAVVLASIAVEFFWASPHNNLGVTASELPWFVSFVACGLLSLAWSTQRRRAQRGLEAMVQERTADLLRSNAALQVEIVERKAAEEELRDAEAELARTLRLATLAELAAAIAHEINQPLAAITANGGACVRSLAHQPPMLDNAREAANCIVSDGHRAADVIARIRALFNKEEPDHQLLDLNQIIERVLDLSRGAIARQQVVARVESRLVPAMVVGDPVQLQQVLVNLVTNALEAMAGITDRPASLTISCAAGPLSSDGNTIVVAVEDSGGGLEPGQLTRIFDSFYTTKPDGVGVGLAISRSIIEAHGGSLFAAPAQPCGARIGFALPAAPAPAAN